MKIALCQTTVHKDWHKNLRNAERVIADAVKSKADMVVLPEMLSVHTTRKPFRQRPSRKAGKHGRRCQRRLQRIMFILWREVYRRARMDIFTVQPILLTEKADRLASIARCICLILMWKVDSITVSPASLRPEMKCVLSKQNLVRLV